MIKSISLVLLALVLGLLGYASTRPDSFRIERSITIRATPDKIFPLLNDFHRWTAWSPWEGLDPAMRRKHSGAGSGLGAVYEWEGNSKVGAGRMEIIGALPPGQLTVQLDFLKPMEGHNIAEFRIEPRGDASQVTWAMQGPAPFLSKLMQVFVSMDRLVGKDFEAGLAKLKAEAEK
jgi:hypothetical protein